MATRIASNFLTCCYCGRNTGGLVAVPTVFSNSLRTACSSGVIGACGGLSCGGGGTDGGGPTLGNGTFVTEGEVVVADAAAVPVGRGMGKWNRLGIGFCPG